MGKSYLEEAISDYLNTEYRLDKHKLRVLTCNKKDRLWVFTSSISMNNWFYGSSRVQQIDSLERKPEADLLLKDIFRNCNPGWMAISLG